MVKLESQITVQSITEYREHMQSGGIFSSIELYNFAPFYPFFILFIKKPHSLFYLMCIRRALSTTWIKASTGSTLLLSWMSAYMGAGMK